MHGVPGTPGIQGRDGEKGDQGMPGNTRPLGPSCPAGANSVKGEQSTPVLENYCVIVTGIRHVTRELNLCTGISELCSCFRSLIECIVSVDHRELHELTSMKRLSIDQSVEL